MKSRKREASPPKLYFYPKFKFFHDIKSIYLTENEYIFIFLQCFQGIRTTAKNTKPRQDEA